MVGNQHELPQIGLARTVRDSGSEIDFAVERQPAQLVPVAPVVGEALVPGPCSWWQWASRPVIRRPRTLLVGRVHAKIEDVELRQPQVLDELPRRMWGTKRLHTAKRRWNTCDCGVEVDMSVSPAKYFLEELPEHLLIHCLGAASTGLL